jgi:hypothetical protein
MKRTTWVLLIILIITIGVYLLIKHQAGLSDGEVNETPVTSTYLGQETDAILISIRMVDNNHHILEMGRKQDGFWEISLPIPGTADQSLASQAETQLAALQIVSSIGKVTSLEDFGLTLPAYSIKLAYSNGVEHKLDVGDQSTIGSGYYIRLDDGDVFVVGLYSIDAVLNLINNPPYPPTNTPTLIPEQATPTANQELPSDAPGTGQPTHS